MAQWPRSQARPGMQQVAAGTARRSALNLGPRHGRCLCPTWSSITGQQSPMKLAPGEGHLQPSQATSSAEKPAGVQKTPSLPLGLLCQLHGAAVSHLVPRDRHLPGHQWQKQSPVRGLRQSHTHLAGGWRRGAVQGLCSQDHGPDWASISQALLHSA